MTYLVYCIIYRVIMCLSIDILTLPVFLINYSVSSSVVSSYASSSLSSSYSVIRLISLKEDPKKTLSA